MCVCVCVYLGPHDLPDGRVKLLGVVEVHRHDVGPADVLLCIGVLGRYLETAHRGGVSWGFGYTEPHGR